jgi:enoyl-CoA hydratase
MSEGTVRFHIEGAIGYITFDRPEARNALTWSMYQELYALCARINADDQLRCVVLRGAGGKAFVAGTDIAQFLDFKSADDGIEYERQGEKFVAAVEHIRVPTIAVVEGWAIGGGLAIASVCDVRIATPESRFGIPIARTLGNGLSARNYARLAAGFGASRVKRMLVLAEAIGAEEAQSCGFVTELVAAEQIDARVAELTSRIAGHAPLSMRTGKESLRRLLHGEDHGNDEDLLAACYGSEDFHLGVAAFVAKTPAQWEGR